MKDYTEIICIIDKSGSMDAVRSDAIGGFNSFLAEQKGLPGEARLTLVLFDTQYRVVCDHEPIGDVKPLTPATYVPGGMTALYDAVVRSIDSVGERLAGMPEEERPAHVIMVILTDGLENSSTDYPGAKGARAVRERIEHQRSTYSWEFVFLAANQDAVLTGGEMGVAANRASTFAADADGVQMAFARSAQAVTSLRTSGEVSADWADDDA
ncbi:MAG: hypothetical protein GF320_10915 [Armatimonadia bacterium]|nr:hypothetical protein [Armatimonadia bacterium]